LASGKTNPVTIACDQAAPTGEPTGNTTEIQFNNS